MDIYGNKLVNTIETNITYLVSCRRSIEMWPVCKIYGIYSQNISWSPEDPIATGTLSAILDFLTDFFAY